MTHKKLNSMTFKQLRSAYLKKALSPVEVTEYYLRVIAEKDPVLNGYANVVGELAMEKAKESEKRYAEGTSFGPLDGIPYAVKDLIETGEVRTCFGSGIYQDYIPKENARVVDILDRAGMILLGKANTHQFAMGVTTDCQFPGVTRNPYDTDRCCGGSSGGSACVLAADMAPAALGTDTGGSIRIPASYCGVVGMKPTYGSVSAVGVMPLSYSLDHVGPMTRSVMENAMLLNAMVEYDAKYDKSIHREREDFARYIGDPINGLKVGVMEDYVEHGDPVQAGVLDGYHKGLHILRDLGAELVPVKTPDRMSDYRMAHKQILAAEAHQIHREDLKNHRDLIDPSVLSRLLEAEMSADEFITFQRLQAEFRRVSEELYEEVDLIALPSTAITASKVRNPMIEVNGQELPIWELATHFTWMGDLNGYPAVSIPVSLAEGLPVGFQLMGKPLKEARIYQAAALIESLV